MASINLSIGLNVDTARILDALTTVEGLSHWWASDTRGACGVGDTIEFHFEGHQPHEMTVLSRPPAGVVWGCIDGPAEWVGTQLAFTLQAQARKTLLLFAHTGWQDTSAFHHHCSMKWAVFLLSLKAYLEEGQGQPFPDDRPITHTAWAINSGKR